MLAASVGRQLRGGGPAGAPHGHSHSHGLRPQLHPGSHTPHAAAPGGRLPAAAAAAPRLEAPTCPASPVGAGAAGFSDGLAAPGTSIPLEGESPGAVGSASPATANALGFCARVDASSTAAPSPIVVAKDEDDALLAFFQAGGGRGSGLVASSAERDSARDYGAMSAVANASGLAASQSEGTTVALEPQVPALAVSMGAAETGSGESPCVALLPLLAQTSEVGLPYLAGSGGGLSRGGPQPQGTASCDGQASQTSDTECTRAGGMFPWPEVAEGLHCRPAPGKGGVGSRVLSGPSSLHRGGGSISGTSVGGGLAMTSDSWDALRTASRALAQVSFFQQDFANEDHAKARLDFSCCDIAELGCNAKCITEGQSAYLRFSCEPSAKC
jgi:hypothetical protein